MFRSLSVALLTTGLLCAAPATSAETFRVSLGKSTLGTLTYSGGANKTLKARLSDTPMGVFNGTFNARSAAPDGAGRIRFSSASASTRKTREIAVTFQNGRAAETLVTPASEMTALSDPGKAPAGVVDAVRAIGKLVKAGDCPGRINIYDGRRAIALVPKAASTEENTQICDMTYQVVAGPGHLSPLKISKAKMRLTYATAPARHLREITIGSGMFNLTLRAQR